MASRLDRAGRWLQPRLPRPLRTIPLPALALISLLIVANLFLWAVAGIVLRFYPALTGSAVLAYTLGLRHALDADHISAIDLMTRRLIAAGQRPVAVGTFFSLGHSTIVIITCIVVAATSGALRDRFGDFQRVGNIIGTSVSAFVLLALCVGNGWVLWRLVRALRQELRQQRQQQEEEAEDDDGEIPPTAGAAPPAAIPNFMDADRVATYDIEHVAAASPSLPITPSKSAATATATATATQTPVAGPALVAAATAWESQTTEGAAPTPANPASPSHPPESSAARHLHLHIEGGGVMMRIFRRMFVLIDRPWKMYPLGVLFGLGFDTSSEVALLGIASLQGMQGTSMWLILLFPALFTVGMCLVDTTDGALMMTLYTSKAFSRDTVAILYYSVVLTGITVIVAAFIGVIQVLTLADNVASPEGSFWDGVGAIGDNFDIIGGSICGLFVVAGIGSVLLYKPWRRYMDRRAARRASVASTSTAAQLIP